MTSLWVQSLACLVLFAGAASSPAGPIAQLIDSTGAAGDNFGYSVGVSADTIVIGAPYDTLAAETYRGSAVVFARSGGAWTQRAKVIASDGVRFDYFGYAVAVSGDTIVVGAPQDNIGTQSDAGSAYVFVRSGNTWTQQTKLVAADAATGDNFGTSVSIWGDTIIIGAPRDNVGAATDQGSAYVFTRDGTTWTQQTRLSAPDGLANDQFGSSVAISAETAIVGAPNDAIGSETNQGSASVFVRSGATWSLQAKLLASDGRSGENFGNAVAIDADTAVVGAFNAWIDFKPGKGAACVFTRSGTAWTQQAKLQGDQVALAAPFSDRGGVPSGNFGNAVAISGHTIVVGAPNDNEFNKPSQGAAYVFTLNGDTWIRRSRFLAPDGDGGDSLGYAVGISGDTLLAGACADDILTSADRGSGWTFRLCPADLNSDTVVDDLDFQLFAAAYNILDCADPSMPAGCPADLNSDAFVDDADFSIFVVAYDVLLCP